MKHSFDCALATNSSIPLLYMRVIISLAIPLMYIFSISVIYLVLISFKQINHKSSYIYSGFVFLTFLLQPGMIALLISTISCRNIGGI
jgi:hypothetical protein